MSIEIKSLIEELRKSLKDIKDSTARDHDLTIEISNNLRNLVGIYDKHEDDDDKKHLDFETRVRGLERDRNLMIGAIIIVQPIIQLLIKYFFK